MVSAPQPAVVAAAAGSLNVGQALLSWLGLGGNGSPAAEPLLWTALAVSRRELTGQYPTAQPAAAVSSGDPNTENDPVVLLQASASSVSQAASVTADPVTSFIRFFIGNGTESNPDAGLLFGNGYSWTGYGGVCTSGPCNGGSGGLIGNGGDGYNGGNGGSAGWFGNGGDGGAALTAGGTVTQE